MCGYLKWGFNPKLSTCLAAYSTVAKWDLGTNTLYIC